MLSVPLLSVLTEDLLVRVYTKLDCESDRKTWRIVCKDFLRVDFVSRRSLRVLKFEFLQNLLSKYTNLDSLDLSVCSRIENGIVSVLLSRPETLNWPRCMTRLILSRATGLRHSGLEMLVRACPLEALDVSYCWQYGDREASVISLARGLRELRMDKCLGVTDVGLAKIVVGCGRLERLSLKWCMEISDLGVHLLCKKCLDLKSLDLSYIKVTSEALSSIAFLLKLEVLAMAGCPLVDDVGLQFLEKGCPSLKEIDVSRCEFVTSAGLISVVRGHSGLLTLNAGYCFWGLPASVLHCLEDLKSLNTIRIDGAQVSDSSLGAISNNCKSLVEIGLSKCVGVTNRGMRQLVSGCVDLKIVNLTCCHSITDAAICALANSCRNLVCLKLESCTKVTEKSLAQLGSCCLQLEELDLTDCVNVDDKGLRSLSRCSELLCLKLGLCTNITDKGLDYIARNCAKVIELDLYRCTGIGDDGLAALSNGCKKLTKLNLSYCIRVTDRGMQYIGHLEELSDLEMRGLANLTSVGLTAIAAGCKRLADLDLKHCENIDDSGFWALAYYARNMRQINMSYCAVSDMGLCMVTGNLTRLQDAKLVNLPKVTVKGFELALRACYVRVRKVKLNASLRLSLSSELLDTLHARGCMFRWV